MAIGMRQRVSNSFESSTREDILQYMDWLRSTMQDLCQSLRRTAALTLLLIAVFELVYGSPRTTLSISAFRVSKGSIVIIFIPALVSYLYLQLVSDTNRLLVVQGAFTAGFSKWASAAEADDLDLLAYPSQALYWQIGRGIYNKTPSLLARLDFATRVGISVVIVLSVLAFESQALYALYPKQGNYLAAWIISACVTIFCTIMGTIQLIAQIDWLQHYGHLGECGWLLFT